MRQQGNFLLKNIFLSGRRLEKIYYQNYLQKNGTTLKIKVRQIRE